MVQEILPVFMDECLTARTKEQVAKQGRWMLQLPFRSGFERWKIVLTGVASTMQELTTSQLEVQLHGASMRTVSELVGSIGTVASQ